MAQQTELEVSPRRVMGKATKRLRKAGIIPANIFGHHQLSEALQIDAIAFERMQREHRGRSMLTLRLPDATTQTALIRHVQHDPRSGKVIHVDFFRVNLSESVDVKVRLHFVGESAAVKNEGGVLLHLLEALEIECAASDIPEFIEVDITPLNEIDDTIHAGDIQLPANVTLITEPTEGVAKVVATKAEMAEEAAEAEAVNAPAPEAAGQAPTKPPAGA